tara:strand:+ start:1047 stop:1448 length:402 start_codon:yes stop_codon:yes gene_type:complete
MKSFFYICVICFSIITSSAQVVIESSNLGLNLSNNYETILFQDFASIILIVKSQTAALEKLNNQFNRIEMPHFYSPTKVNFYYLIDAKWIFFHNGIAINFDLYRNLFKSKISKFKVKLIIGYYTTKINKNVLV